MRYTFICALALTSVFTQSVCAAALLGKGVVVKPVQSSLAEESFQTELVNRALQKLGYDVQPTNEVDYNVAYTAIANGKADLSGCTPGWGCEAVINHHIKAYGLSATVEHNQGNYAAIMADTISRYKEGKPILYYTWTPYWVSDVLVPGRDVVWLQVPFSSLPGEQKGISTKLPNGADYGFPVNSMRIVANKQWAEANPAAAKLFAIMKLPIAYINAQNARMHQGEAQEADIERQTDGWIKAHQALFDGWVNTAAAAAK
ncbi:MAG: glycine betaine/L-proline ABC transporter substrate-binding protein ProX [Sodalis sp. (in: enterobacteria)]|uniref:glycine betaine/L-proline ABC transporter substrate-binding protein ProX n=1 Tax=Sodalis sp. (in: enterobacteria) TaxID=1898979 RepID=UPI0039E6A0DF